MLPRTPTYRGGKGKGKIKGFLLSTAEGRGRKGEGKDSRREGIGKGSRYWGIDALLTVYVSWYRY